MSRLNAGRDGGSDKNYLEKKNRLVFLTRVGNLSMEVQPIKEVVQVLTPLGLRPGVALAVEPKTVPLVRH